MKKAILFIAALFAFCRLFAQQETVPPSRGKIDENSIVNDSLGNRLKFETWLPMVQSGNYTLKSKTVFVNGKPSPDAPIEYVVAAASAEQKARILAMMEKSNAARAVNLEQRMLAMKPPESEFFTTGEKVQPFTMRPIDGKKIDSKDWAGKTVVLNFWFIGCPPCRAEIPDLNKIADKYKDNPNVIFIAIALDPSWDIKDFVKGTPYNYRLVADGTFYAKRFDINLYPTNVVIDKTGKVRFHSSGGGGTSPYWISKTIEESEKAIN